MEAYTNPCKPLHSTLQPARQNTSFGDDFFMLYTATVSQVEASTNDRHPRCKLVGLILLKHFRALVRPVTGLTTR